MRIWRAFGLQPHQVENLKFSKDPRFMEKVRDIVFLAFLNFALIVEALRTLIV